MQPPYPSIVLVHGAWHTPANYKTYICALETAGFEVHCPQLPSCSGEPPPKAGLTDDVATIRETVEGLVSSGRQVVVVMHSYGGVVGTDALECLSVTHRKAQGKEGGVQHLVYMCAYILPEHAAAWDVVEEAGFTEIFKQVIEVPDDGSTFPVDHVQTFFTGEPPDGLDTSAAQYRRFPMQALQERTAYAAWRAIPATYIYTSNDHGVPPVYQKNMMDKVEAAGVKLKKEHLESHHSPFISHEKEMVEVVKQACLDKRSLPTEAPEHG